MRRAFDGAVAGQQPRTYAQYTSQGFGRSPGFERALSHSGNDGHQEERCLAPRRGRCSSTTLGLLQPSATSLFARISQSDRLRKRALNNVRNSHNQLSGKLLHPQSLVGSGSWMFSEKEVLSKGQSRVRPLESTSFLNNPERIMNKQATSRTFIIQVEHVPSFWVNSSFSFP